jgi:CBS domain-containing protein
MSKHKDQNIDKALFEVPLSEVKLTEIPMLEGDCNLKEAVSLMQKHHVGALCYVRDKCATGMISERDLVRKIDLDDLNWLEKPCKEVMTPGPFTLSISATVSDAIKLMARRSFRNIPVVNESGEYIGLLTIKDLLEFVIRFFPNNVSKYGIVESWHYQTVDDYSEGFSTSSENLAYVSGNIFLAHLNRVCHNRPLLLDHQASVSDAIELMRERKRGAVILTRYETELKGIITERDVLQKVLGKMALDGTLKVCDIMTPNPHTLLSKHYLAHAINNMFHFKYRSNIVVNEDNYPLSIVSLLDIFKFVAFNFYKDELSIL